MRPAPSDFAIEGRATRDESPVPLAPIAPATSKSPEAALEARDGNAVDSFVRQHYAFTWRVLRRLGLAPADADDAAQRVFMIASGRLGDIVQGCERAFLYRTAAHVASKVHRAQRRRPDRVTAEIDEPVDALPLPDALLDQRRARALLDRILSELAPDLHAVFVLFEIEGLKAPEVADALEIPLGTVASRLRRARSEVSERLARYEARASFKTRQP